MLAETGETETATEPEGGGIWLEGEEAEEVPQAARSGARRRSRSGGKLLEREDIVGIVWRAGEARTTGRRNRRRARGGRQLSVVSRQFAVQSSGNERSLAPPAWGRQARDDGLDTKAAAEKRRPFAKAAQNKQGAALQKRAGCPGKSPGRQIRASEGGAYTRENRFVAFTGLLATSPFLLAHQAHPQPVPSPNAPTNPNAPPGTRRPRCFLPCRPKIH